VFANSGTPNTPSIYYCWMCCGNSHPTWPRFPPGSLELKSWNHGIQVPVRKVLALPVNKLVNNACCVCCCFCADGAPGQQPSGRFPQRMRCSDLGAGGAGAHAAHHQVSNTPPVRNVAVRVGVVLGLQFPALLLCALCCRRGDCVWLSQLQVATRLQRSRGQEGCSSAACCQSSGQYHPSTTCCGQGQNAVRTRQSKIRQCWLTALLLYRLLPISYTAYCSFPYAVPSWCRVREVSVKLHREGRGLLHGFSCCCDSTSYC
jgi:hypothetical protein